MFFIFGGLLAGFFSGLFGVGGGFFMVPLMHWIFVQFDYHDNVALHTAIGTSLGVILITSSYTSYCYHARGLVMWKPLKSVVLYTFIGGMMGAFVMMFIHARWLLLLFGLLMVLMMMDFMGLIMRFPQASSWKYGSGFVAGAIAMFSAALGVGGGLLSSRLVFSERVIPVRAVAGTASAFCIVVSAGSLVSALFLSYTTGIPWSLGTVNFVGLFILAGSAFLTIPVAVVLANMMSQKVLSCLFATMCLGIAFYAFVRAWLLF